MLYDNPHVEIARSARRHGVHEADIRHAVAHVLVLVEIDDGNRAPKVLAIGPSRSGNPLELVAIEGPSSWLVIHAMRLRRSYEWLLEGGS